MKKIICLVLCCSVLIFCLSSCGFNAIMRKYLSDKGNYKDINVILKDMFYINPRTYKSVYAFDPTQITNCNIYFKVIFKSTEELLAFIDGDQSTNLLPLEEHHFILEITADNHKILCENGFYEQASIGDEIHLKSSNWIYMDGHFDYVAYVEHDNTEYLSFEDGLKNIVDMMNKNKSLI